MNNITRARRARLMQQTLNLLYGACGKILVGLITLIFVFFIFELASRHQAELRDVVGETILFVAAAFCVWRFSRVQ